MTSTHPFRASLRSVALITIAGLTLWGAMLAVAPPAPAGYEPIAAPTRSDRGELLSGKRLLRLSKEEAAKELTAVGFDRRAVRNGVDTYRLIYHTVDPQGRPTTASGLLALPRDDRRRLPTVSYAHGTEAQRSAAPSAGRDRWVRAPAITYASAGFATVAPDYLGLGTGPGFHPWFDLPSETTASLDMLEATRTFVARKGVALRRQVLVAGFSQGASAALGLGRALQESASTRFRLGALAPISGAYDFRAAELPALLNGDLHPKASVLYVAYLLVAWDRLHDLYGEPAEVFQGPYDATVEQLFDGLHADRQILAGLPDRLTGLLTPRGFEMLQHPSGPLAEALAVADSVCTGWVPSVPVRLFVGSRDREVALANSDHCLAALRSNGATARLIDVGKVDHYGSAALGTAATVRWFRRLAG
jgi:hypothetical protein